MRDLTVRVPDVLGGLALVGAAGLLWIGPPGQGPVAPADPPEQTDEPPQAHSLRRIFLVLGVVNGCALPLWLVYLHRVLWPTANLGGVAACQTLTALLAWRPTTRDVAQRAW